MLPRLLLDTHIVVRWLTDAKKLSREQVRVLEAAVRRTEPVALSAVSLLEIAVLSSQGKLRLKMTIDEFFGHLQTGPVFQILPLTFEVAAEVASLGSLRDPADRAIVATARIERLRLVTSDQRIIESKLVPVVV
ncbi:MAG TPA: type II toxin-antitoxin system VapC family toxin [Bryobacteraceae bacterium]|nr:type II toxin-antitoxin system VapC family toxin [Bryobacteraceae bacterium]